MGCCLRTKCGAKTLTRYGPAICGKCGHLLCHLRENNAHARELAKMAMIVVILLCSKILSEFFPSVAATTHWIVTEDGRIQSQVILGTKIRLVE